MSRRAIRAIVWVGLMVAVIVTGLIAPATTGAAGFASLSDITAGCHQFSLTATFRGTVDEENGFDYVRLRVIDAGGNEVYTSAPWGALWGVQEVLDFSAEYQHTPVAGPLLFVLEDFVRLEVRQLQSLATAIVMPDCATLPALDQPLVTLTCNARLRTGPGLNYRWRRFLQAGTALTVFGRLFDSSWVHVRVAETGLIGWVYEGRCVPGSAAGGTYARLPVTFFRTPEEVLLYQFQPAP